MKGRSQEVAAGRKSGKSPPTTQLLERPSLLCRQPRGSRGPSAGLRDDARGAVYVEFLIAFMPFFVFFLCLWQVSILYYTKLLVDHAAFAAARAAAVIVAENPKRVDPNGGDSSVNKLTDARDAYVRTAAEIALAPLIVDRTVVQITVSYPAPTDPGGKDAMRNQTYSAMTESSVSLMRVRVEALMNCKIAFANGIMCPSLGGLVGMFTVTVRSEAVFPYQGASYQYNPNDG
jgi:TadE-like protein